MKSIKPKNGRRLALLFILVACGTSDSKFDGSQQTLPRASESTRSRPAAASVQPQDFVQQFYDWYIAASRAEPVEPAWYAPLSTTPAVLSPGLLDALRKDSMLQAESPREIAGLEFDPFLASQDACDRYEVGNITRDGAVRRVDVHSICSGIRGQSPDVVAELEPHNHSWTIRNIIYPKQSGALLMVLKQIHH